MRARAFGCGLVAVALVASAGPRPNDLVARGAHASCHVEAQCGCARNTSTVWLRYHKTGSVLTSRLMSDLDTVCGIGSVGLREVERNGSLTVDAALAHVTRARPCAQPNIGFIGQLRQLQARLAAEAGGS